MNNNSSERMAEARDANDNKKRIALYDEYRVNRFRKKKQANGKATMQSVRANREFVRKTYNDQTSLRLRNGRDEKASASDLTTTPTTPS